MTSAPLILIVGMHRSGTSLLGNLLKNAGVSMPGPLIAGDQHNPEGYFERADITDLQERLLIDLDRWWPSDQGTQPLPPDWLCRPSTHAALNRLRTLLERESGQQQGPWAIKDPRSSLLLPLWRRLAGELQIPLRLILAVRQPAEVVQSLCQRDASAAGMTPERAELLWWHHNQAVLRHALDLPLLLVDYSQWFSPGDGPKRQLQQLWAFCGLPTPLQPADQLARGLEQIKPEHRRSASAAANVPLHASTNKLFQQLVAGKLGQAENASLPQHNPLAHQAKRWLHSSIRQSRLLARNGWFDPHDYKRRYSDLAQINDPLAHYCQFGWREGRQPHPLFNPGHYLQCCLEHGLVPPAELSPLEHFLAWGLSAGLVPTPLAQPRWLQYRQVRLSTDRPPTLSDLHPWGDAALALADGDLAAAACLLSHWQSNGFPAADWRSIAQASSPWLRWGINPPITLKEGSSSLQPVSTSGLPLKHWLSQGWLAGLHGTEPSPGQRPIDRLHLILLPPGQLPEQAELIALAHDPGVLVVDADPQRCLLLQRLNMAWAPLVPPNAERLDRQFPAEPWLERAQSLLGLPAPAALASRPMLTFGSGGPLWDAQTGSPERWCLPGFDQLLLSHAEAPRALTAWLWHCHRQGIQLVRLSGDSQAQATQQPVSWLPLEWICVDGLSPASLEWELSWRAAGRPDPATPSTPRPATDELWQGGDGRKAAAVAVVVSLHNYAERIEAALASVAAQRLEALELVVVDDASTDHSAATAQRWLEQHGQRFCRAQLLQHRQNGGLAAARNTAFAATQAPWCLVLDADNALLPDAASSLLAVAEQGSEQLAVVHPLIELQQEQATDHLTSNGLLSTLSWQINLFQRSEGNYIDAMALVRRRAWEAVGGYVHIPGGWEDFDFWCLLIEAGFHGVLCPAVIAQYRSHGDSMLHRHTHSNVRRISRLLQHRHPWLNLRLGQADF